MKGFFFGVPLPEFNFAGRFLTLKFGFFLPLLGGSVGLSHSLFLGPAEGVTTQKRAQTIAQSLTRVYGKQGN